MKYIRYVTSIANGATSAKVVSDISAEQYANVIFMVQSPNEGESELVAQTIAALFNKLIYDFKTHVGNLSCEIRNHNDWSTGNDNPNSTHYVYAYATPKDYLAWKFSEPSYQDDLNNYRIFYIGRGQNTRFTAHITESIDSLSRSSTNNVPNLEIGKIRAIQEFLLKEAESSGSKMVRKLAQFYGTHAVAQYAATEYFLINYWQGIYALENLTAGDSHVSGSKCEWLCRPKTIPGDSPAWKEIVQNFSDNGVAAATQRLTRRLVVEELNSVFQQRPLPNLENLIGSITFNGAKAIDNGTDAFYSLTLHNSSKTPLLQIHLKLSDKHTGVCLNIRKLQGDSFDTFSQGVAGIFFSNANALAEPHIKNAGDPYFKPCVSGVNGKNDIWFDFRKPDSPEYDISGTPLSRATGATTNQSLYSVLKLISGLAKSIK